MYEVKKVEEEFFVFEEDSDCEVSGPYDSEAEAWQSVVIPITIEAPTEEDCLEGSARTTLVVDQDGRFPREVPLGWLNSASIDVDRDRETVTLSVSVGDPRGAFTLVIRRTPDGQLIMHVPDAGEPLYDLEKLHEGTYKIL